MSFLFINLNRNEKLKKKKNLQNLLSNRNLSFFGKFLFILFDELYVLLKGIFKRCI